MKGVAPIKNEFLRKFLETAVNDKPQSENTPDSTEDTNAKREPTSADLEDGNNKKRRKGQNKKREKYSTRSEPAENRLCKSFLNDKCTYGDSCKFSHDIKAYVAKKPDDIGDRCYNFDQFGKCPFSFACRFAKAHVKEENGEMVNVVVDPAVNSASKTVNGLTVDNLRLLRKHKYDFSKALAATDEAKAVVDKIVKENVEKNCTKKDRTVSTNGDDCSEDTAAAVDAVAAVAEDPKAEVLAEQAVVQTEPEKPVGPVTNEDQFTIKPGEKKTIDFDNKLYLAPLTTVGNLPFRRICKTFGADITCGEMALATHLLQGMSSEWALVKRHSSEDVFGVQICGSHADHMAKCAQLLTDTCDIDFIDINVGCPIDLIFDMGAGSALMRRTNRFHEIVHAMVKTSPVPITAKIRTGIADSTNTAHKLLAKMKNWGLALTTLHGRSREQRYTRTADWQYIDECAEAAAPMPLYGGGDILSFEDYNAAMKTGVSGTMIARGALIKPWLFTEIKEQRHWDITSSQRLDILRDFVNFGLEHWGSDQQGVETTRKFLLEWLSFLHRYIPVGLLETLPQKINERPPPYIGRDDLETLMASPNSSDWVKISEMLLGPIPENFFFIPKHRANSYS